VTARLGGLNSEINNSRSFVLQSKKQRGFIPFLAQEKRKGEARQRERKKISLAVGGSRGSGERTSVQRASKKPGNVGLSKGMIAKGYFYPVHSSFGLKEVGPGSGQSKRWTQKTSLSYAKKRKERGTETVSRHPTRSKDRGGRALNKKSTRLLL